MNLLGKRLFNILGFNGRYIHDIKQINFAILFDIDGVLIRGCTAVDGAKQMFNFMSKQGLMNKLPFALLTNSSESPEIKAKTLTEMFNIQIGIHQIINAPAPLIMFTEAHNKRTLFVGQGDLKQDGAKLGFKRVFEISDVQHAYPTLDVIDVRKRRKLKEGYVQHGMEPIEAVVLIGEPTDWQSYIQILVDLLVTNGDPSSTADHDCEQLPVYVCNLDFLYTAESHMSRFGNGAFLHCLEEVYQKYSGKKLQYSAVIGKPSEISFRYAEHILNGISNNINNGAKIERVYMVGDNPASDIIGANLYQHFLDFPTDLPGFRVIPPSIDMLPSTVKSVKAVLVNTGVYDGDTAFCSRHQHWTFANIEAKHRIPTMIVNDCFEAFYRILEIETISAGIK